jgi:hypothetical protein
MLKIVMQKIILSGNAPTTASAYNPTPFASIQTIEIMRTPTLRYIMVYFRKYSSQKTRYSTDTSPTIPIPNI